jgi:hypothetical protein
MRLKIIAGNLVAIVVIGLVSYFVVRSQIESTLTAEIDAEILNDQKLFDRSWKLSVVEFVGHVTRRAQAPEVAASFKGVGADSRRQRAFNAVERIAQWFRDPARGRPGAPDIVAITDETGKVVARDSDPNRMHGASLVRELPTLRKVLDDGHARHDVWNKADEGKLLQTGIAPIYSDKGSLIGTLVVGYDVSNGLAESEAELLGRQVAFLAEDEVYSSSLPDDQIEPLEKHLYGPLESSTTAAITGGNTTPWDAKLGGVRYEGVTAPLAKAPSAKVAVVVLANKTEALALASSTHIILLMTLLGLLGAGAYGFIVGSSFLRPLEQIEEGVLQVINGRTDLRIDVTSAEFGGLAYRINQLINVFTGVAEEDEEGRVSQPPASAGGSAWQGAAFASEAGGASASGGQAAGGGGASGGDVIDDPAVAKELAAEDEATYLARVYKEYVAAKQGVGEDVSNIPQERFSQRLKGNAKALSQKHGVSDVRFRVETRGNQVVLRPVLIR